MSVEEQFYLLWPWFLAAFQKDLRRLTHLLIAAIVLVDIYRVVFFFKLHVDDHWLSYTFDGRADHLLVGCLLAVLLKRGALMSFWISHEPGLGLARTVRSDRSVDCIGLPLPSPVNSQSALSWTRF